MGIWMIWPVTMCARYSKSRPFGISGTSCHKTRRMWIRRQLANPHSPWKWLL